MKMAHFSTLVDSLMISWYQTILAMMAKKSSSNTSMQSSLKKHNKIVAGEKLIRIIKSCLTVKQLDNCITLIDRFTKLYDDQDWYKILTDEWFEQSARIREMSYENFKQEINEAIKNKPEYIRAGQAVFNYIDEKYHVARLVQFNDHIDCFYNDGEIDRFVDAAYKHLV